MHPLNPMLQDTNNIQCTHTAAMDQHLVVVTTFISPTMLGPIPILTQTLVIHTSSHLAILTGAQKQRTYWLARTNLFQTKWKHFIFRHVSYKTKF